MEESASTVLIRHNYGADATTVFNLPVWPSLESSLEISIDNIRLMQSGRKARVSFECHNGVYTFLRETCSYFPVELECVDMEQVRLMSPEQRENLLQKLDKARTSSSAALEERSASSIQAVQDSSSGEADAARAIAFTHLLNTPDVRDYPAHRLKPPDSPNVGLLGYPLIDAVERIKTGYPMTRFYVVPNDDV